MSKMKEFRMMQGEIESLLILANDINKAVTTEGEKLSTSERITNMRLALDALERAQQVASRLEDIMKIHERRQRFLERGKREREADYKFLKFFL